MTDEEWLRYRDPNCCEAPGCTGRGKRRVPAVLDLDRDPLPDLRHVLCLCTFHFEALDDRILAACWGVPPGNVVWRLGIPEVATWYRNERKLTLEEVERWMQTPAARFT
jgi:hypothetical protein